MEIRESLRCMPQVHVIQYAAFCASANDSQRVAAQVYPGTMQKLKCEVRCLRDSCWRYLMIGCRTRRHECPKGVGVFGVHEVINSEWVRLLS